jgi:hypothetical protein
MELKVDAEMRSLIRRHGQVVALALLDDVEELERDLAEARKSAEKLEAIAAWCVAYPVESFLPLAKSDWKVARLALLRENLSIDRISADNYRHVLDGIAKIINPPAQEESKP